MRISPNNWNEDKETYMLKESILTEKKLYFKSKIYFILF